MTKEKPAERSNPIRSVQPIAEGLLHGQKDKTKVLEILEKHQKEISEKHQKEISMGDLGETTK